MLTTGAVGRLLHGVGGEDTEDDRHVDGVGIELAEVDGDRLAEVVEVGRLALDDTADGEDRVELLCLEHSVAAIDELEASWHILHEDILLLHAILFERVDGALGHTIRDLIIPLGDDEGDSLAGRVRDGRGVVVAEIGCRHMVYTLLVLLKS